jgi:hypothetical protein
MATGQQSQPSSASSGASSGANQAAGGAQSSGGTSSGGRKRGGTSGPRKASPKVKALSEVRTFLIQQRSQALSGKTGVEQAIEKDRFDRMIDAVENLFPGGHTHNVPRETDAAAS